MDEAQATLAMYRVGHSWQSSTLFQRFIITGDQATVMIGNDVFAGWEAKRETDGVRALVALDFKPTGYSFDFLLVV